jgi:hypothetical protein
MRDKINVLYYPDFWVAQATLVKAILLFDELHFMDRPSMTFGQFGTIGSASPLRQVEAAFRNEGVPFYVHPAPMGPVHGEWYEHIRADVNDPEFLKRFQNGLKTSPTFRNLQVVPGNYGEYGDQNSVAQRLVAVDLSADLKTHGSPMALFEDSGIRHFDLSTPVGCAKTLISDAVTCSAKLNFALNAGTKQAFFPLADARPYGDLLGAKYARAINNLGPSRTNIQVTDLSFAIFDELIPAERLKELSLEDAIRYRKASETAREEFLEHLSVIQAKQSDIGPDADYTGAIDKLIDTEIKPAARDFKKRLQAIDESLVGSIAKGVVGAASGPSVLTFFGDLSWQRILAVGVAAAAYVSNALIDSIIAQRAAKRDCSISYILSLDDKL